MSASIVVSMNQIIVVATQALATVATELRSRFTAPFLMFLQFFRTTESPDITHLYLLAGLQGGIQSDFHAWSRLDNTRMRNLRPCASKRLGFRVRLRLWMALGF